MDHTEQQKLKMTSTETKKIRPWRRYLYQLMAAEISSMVKYYDRIIQVKPVMFDEGDLLDRIQAKVKYTFDDLDLMPDLSGEETQRTAILLNGNINFTFDIQQIFRDFKPRMARTSRIVAVAYNPYHKGLFRLMTALKLSRSGQMTTFVTKDSLEQLAELEGFEMVSVRPVCYLPLKLLGLGWLINKVTPAIPVFRWLSFATIIVFRPRIASTHKPSLSIVIPARNEAGNIRRALEETPQMEGVKTELIFVEGHSSDDTWEVIQAVVNEGHDFFELSCFQQTGKGKVDAVRLGFAQSKGELLTILDADLTMPPEMVPRFYDAYVQGHADYINGSRLLYPMEGEAMPFLNHLGNLFFAKALSALTDLQLGDSLCGTKLVAAHDYERFKAWREDFGDFDPFGDFELIFPASVLGLSSADIPVRYKARTYGSTNINRFRHGLILLKMTMIGLFRIRMGRLR
jgi:hypothetical protein